MGALFKIGDRDITPFITVPSYVVNSKDIYEEFSDGSYNFRRSLIRTRITGTFSLLFSEQSEFMSFLELIKRSKTKEGAITATVYVNNLMETKTSQFYIEMEVANILPLLGRKKVDTIDVTIEER